TGKPRRRRIVFEQSCLSVLIQRAVPRRERCVVERKLVLDRVGGGERLWVRRACGRIGGQRGAYQRRQRVGGGTWKPERRQPHVGERVAQEVFRGKRRSARQHLEQDGACREHIVLLRGRRPAALLGRHVQKRAGRRRQVGSPEI